MQDMTQAQVDAIADAPDSLPKLVEASVFRGCKPASGDKGVLPAVCVGFSRSDIKNCSAHLPGMVAALLALTLTGMAGMRAPRNREGCFIAYATNRAR
jgi:hypothetical protein